MSEFAVITSDRYVIIPESQRKIGVQFDHNAETISFECPRYWDGRDLSEMKIYVNYMRPDESLGSCLCENVTVDPSDDTIIHFDWVISGHTTEYAGVLSMLVCARDVDENGKIVSHWNSELTTGLYVSSGMKCRDTIVKRHPDIITQLLRRMDVVEAAPVSAAASAANAKASEMNAALSASNAAISEANAAASALSAQTNADNLNADLINARINLKADNLYFDTTTNLLYLMSDGEIIGDGVAVATSGGGGGGGGSTAEFTITLTNLLEDRVFSVPGGADVNLEFTYTSTDEEGYSDGPGIGTITVNNVKKATLSIPQGDRSIPIASYLSNGSNTVKLKVENSEGNSRTLTYTITVITLTVSATLKDFTVQNGDLTLYYTPVGSGEKTVYFLIDGEIIGTQTVTASGKSQTYIIPAQKHGGHVLEVYATMLVDNVAIISEPIKRGIVWIDNADMTPVILMMFEDISITQGETISIPYMVYNPANETASVTFSVLNEDGSVYSSQELTVGRTADKPWIIQDYPVGNITVRIACGSAIETRTVSVSASDVTFETITDSLALDFNPAGRTNQEANPSTWTDGSVTASFSNIGFSGADGWLTDTDGSYKLRILPGGEMTIPYQLFASDRRDSGVTVEVEMSTHNVRNYDSVVLSCLSGGRGFKVASQYAQMSSEQSSISMQFKEDDRVRLTFVAEPVGLNRLIYVYVDGIMCGVIQYPEDDNFQQNPAVGITIGAESSGIDLYRVLMYTKGLTRAEVLDNYISGRATFQQRLAAHSRNDLINTAEEIVISKLPATLPYMIIACPELPQFKDDKKTCTITYVNPADPSYSFTAENVQIDVQGTSSAGYKKKNFKPKFKGGFTYTATGETSDTYKLRADSIPVSVFCLKADVASSEGANNVELVRFYNDVCPYKTPPQKADSRVRVGIDGLPIIVFWENTTTGEVKFWGKYNANNDKSTAETFGLTSGCESWEIRNNTSDRVLFKKSDYGDGWLSDFEARYPEDSTDYTNLKRLTDWIVSTDRSAVSTEEEKTARLNKFKMEFEDYFVKDPTLFYYLFTECFLMVDSRAKNLFPSTFDGVHWMPLPYDMDTALGINNEGALVFDYDLEDTDVVEGADVFNGKDSVLWCNVRDAFGDDIREMYATLRGGTMFNYDTIIKRFSDHQSVWPEVIWNEDAYEKYLEPLLNDKDGSYLSMLQGSKASQREWWLYNGLRYRDSKYQTGDAQKQYITLRCYEVGDITVTPYSHIWPRIKYGSYTVTERGKRNVATTLVCPLDKMNDTEVYIYSADRLSNIGDLSHLMVGYANFSMATKLQSLKLGDSKLDESGVETYTNTRLSELYIGNNELLATLDVRNCVNLTMTVDLSGCAGLETIEAGGSSIPGLTLPIGGNLKTLHLPGTMTNLTLRSMKQLTELTMEGYSALTTLRIENTPNVPLETIVNGAVNLERVRLVDIDWTATDEDSLRTTITRLASCGGLTADGANVDTAVVSGIVRVATISDELFEYICANFPDLAVDVGGVVRYFIRYLNHDATLLYRVVLGTGGTLVDPVASGLIPTPTRAPTDTAIYTYSGWSEMPTEIARNYTIVAQYDVAYRVRFLVDDSVYDTQWVLAGESAVLPNNPVKESTVQYVYTFDKWVGNFNAITGPIDIVAEFASALRVYTVRFYNGAELLQAVDAEYGSTAVYTGDTPVYTEEDYVFIGWSPEPNAITGDMNCYALFKYTGKYSVKIANRSLAGAYENDRVTSVGGYVFYSCDALESISLPAATTIGSRAFRYCYNLTTVNIPVAVMIDSAALSYCESLQKLDLPKTTSIGSQAFYRCISLDALVLRSEKVCSLGGSNAFTDTPIEAGTGYIYVPGALIDEYKNATNWSTYADRFRAIEDYADILGGAV